MCQRARVAEDRRALRLGDRKGRAREVGQDERDIPALHRGLDRAVGIGRPRDRVVVRPGPGRRPGSRICGSIGSSAGGGSSGVGGSAAQTEPVMAPTSRIAVPRAVASERNPTRRPIEDRRGHRLSSHARPIRSTRGEPRDPGADGGETTGATLAAPTGRSGFPEDGRLRMIAVAATRFQPHTSDFGRTEASKASKVEAGPAQDADRRRAGRRRP